MRSDVAPSAIRSHKILFTTKSELGEHKTIVAIAYFRLLSRFFVFDDDYHRIRTRLLNEMTSVFTKNRIWTRLGRRHCGENDCERQSQTV